MLRVLFGLAVAHTACWGVGHDVTDMSCNLQKRRPDADLHLELELRKPALELADFAMPAASTESARPALLAEGPSSPWLMPGVHFQQCSRPKAKRPTRSLLQTRGQSTEEPLPNRVICPPGQMAIGNFVGDAYQAYHFTCCDAGQQCGGCRKVVNGTCQECAAGYIHQQIPILNITKCFMCDDVPGWQDANGLSCRDYETKGYCPGYVKSGHDEPFHGVRPSEACCACGGGDVLATPTVMRFGYMAVASGDTIDEFPEPQALGTEVSSCNLAQWGLNLTGSGRIQGIVTSLSQNRTSIKCSLVLMQDPMRGISTTADLDVSVGTFSYGEQVLVFKYWGLESEPSSKAFHVHQQTLPQGHSLENFQLNCNCPCLGKS